MSIYDSWPVDNVSAAHVTNEGGETFGDQTRVYELASVTKLLATYGFLVALEEGAFDLDEQIPVVPGRTATPRELLAHASGVGFAATDPLKEPRSRRIYSSYGFEILARHLENEAEMPFSEYLNQAVFQPLGMGTATLWGSPGHQARASAYDLVAFAQEVLAPTLISEDTLQEATTCQFPELPGIVPGYGMYKPCPWGLGFEIKGAKSGHWMGDNSPGDTIGHFGQSGTYLWVHRPSGKAAIALTDRDFGPWAKPLWQETNQGLWAR